MKAIFSVMLALAVLTACTSEEEKEQQAIMKEFTDVGDRIAKISFASLSGKLKAAISEGGIPNAIKFCNINALPLTDSLSKTFDAQIKRTSLKLRNPKNQPDSLEAYMLDLYTQIQKMQKPLVSKTLLARNNDVRYFAPIVLKAACLTCHGTVGQDIGKETYAIIKEHYPYDQAVGFEEGELRGIWSINFGKIEALAKAPAKTN
jgi:Protein of unknown function (DUF3365)